MSPHIAVHTCFFINGFVFANWAARIPRLQLEYGLDNQALGFTLLAHSIGAFIAMPVSGWMIIRNGSRRITVISAILFCIFFCCVPWAPTASLLLIPYFFMGAATGVMDVAMNAQAVVVEKELGKPVMTLFHGLFSIGMVIGGLTGALFSGIEWTLKSHFVLAGVASLLIVLMIARFLHPDTSSKATHEGPMFVWPKGGIVIFGIIAFCCMLGEGAMADWSANYLRNALGTPETTATLGLTAFAACMTVGRLVGDKGRLMYGDKKLLKSCAGISLVGIGVVLLKFHLVTTIIGFGLVGLGLSVVVPIVYSLSGTFPGIQPGVGIAMSTTIGYAGFMIGPPLIGFIADETDIRTALFFVLALFLIMTLLIYRIPGPQIGPAISGEARNVGPMKRPSKGT